MKIEIKTQNEFVEYIDGVNFIWLETFSDSCGIEVMSPMIHIIYTNVYESLADGWPYASTHEVRLEVDEIKELKIDNEVVDIETFEDKLRAQREKQFKF